MIHLNVCIYYILYIDQQNQYKMTPQPPCKYTYTHINRDIYSVNELNMETDFSTSLRKYYSISVS